MMGRAHALSGAAAWLAGAPLLAHTTGWFQLDTATWLMGGVIAAGGAVAPDLDHPNRSSARNALKPITPIIGKGVNIISGGHRQGTHSILGVAAFAILMALAAGPLAPWGVLISSFFLVAFACKALGFNLFKYIPVPFSQGIATVVTAGAVTFAVYWFSAGNYDWFIWAAACSYAVHLLGDLLTVEGLRPLAPFQWQLRISQMRAGGVIEMVVLTPVFIVLIVWAGFQGISTGRVFSHPVDVEGRSPVSIALPWMGTQDPSPPAGGKKKPSKKVDRAASGKAGSGPARTPTTPPE